MEGLQEQTDEIALRARNIGGISATGVRFERGVNVLSGRNATNRTSLLQAIMGGMGSMDISLKGDRDEAEIRVATPDGMYTRSIERRDGSLSFSGEPYLDDPEPAERFAFLLESNEARRAVERGDDLREIIMSPVDTTAVQREIDDLVDRRGQIDEQLENLSSLERKLPDLEQERTRIEDELEENAAAIADLEATIEEMDPDVEKSRAEKERLEAKLNETQATRNELEDVEDDIEAQQKSLEVLYEDRATVENELHELPEVTEERRQEIEGRIERLRERQNRLVSRLNELQSIIQFNEEVLEGNETALFEELAEETEGHDEVTDQLVPESNTITCWTCGSEVEDDAIDENVSRLRSVHQDMLKERRSLRSEIDELEEQLRTLKGKQQRRENAKRNQQRIEAEIEEREATLEEMQERQAAVETELETLEAEVDDLQKEEERTEILERQKELNQLDFDRDRLKDDLDDITTEIETVQERIEAREDLEARRETIQADLEEARTRIERIESEAIEAFNNHMEQLLEILQYANIKRIWIDRTTKQVKEGRQTVERGHFELHVVRRSEDGAAYEDRVEHLSESEREVTGLVFALAGYLTHDLHETVPFMLLDSLEALDSERIADLVEYLSDFPDHLVVALLPEDAAALSDDYTYITDI
jgi:DNA repair exonuclease SbcCD ATPase subunit